MSDILRARHKSQGKSNPAFKNFIGGEVRCGCYHGMFPGQLLMVPSFKVKALDHLLLSQKSHEASQLGELERKTA